MHGGKHTKRQYLVVWIVCLMWAALWFRIAMIQFVDHERLYHKAITQREREVTLDAVRGSILDRNGVDLAVSIPSASYGIRPDDISDAKAAVSAIAGATGYSVPAVNAMVTSDKSFLWLVRQADAGVARRLDESGVRGINRIEEARRYYPLGNVGAQLIGYTDVDGRGIEGAELYAERDLAGFDGRSTVLRDARGRSVASLDDPEVAPRNGSDVVLTIDSRIQEMVDEELAAALERTHSRWGGAIVVNAGTGEILAMSNAPGFDPNSPASFGKQFDANRRRNRLVTDMFEPGSTFKIVTFAEALESGAITETDEIDCENGKYRLYNHTINDTHELDIVPAAEVLIESSNIGTVKIADLIGESRLYERARLMGFGAVLGADFPNETPGDLPNPRDWSGLSLATISFGQGIAASPLQTVMAYAAVANGGILLRPRLVKEVRGEDGVLVRGSEPVTIRRVMKPETARRLEILLEGVVESGTGETAALPNVTIAGKTGTAQRVRDDGRGYEPGKYVSSFVGYLCDRSPRIVCLVILDSPEGGYYGSQIAAPVFRNIMNRMLNMGDGSLTVPVMAENDGEPGRGGIIGGLQGIAAAAGRFAKIGFGIDASADSVDTPRRFSLPDSRGRRKSVSEIELTENGKVAMPDLKGLTMREAASEAVDLNLDVSISGSGIVTGQSPKAGALISPGTVCSIVCEKR